MPRPAFLVAGVAALVVGLLVLDPNVLTAVATAALTGFAALQILAEREKRRSDARAADARLSVNAWELRKGLGGWIAKSQEVGWSQGLVRAQEALGCADRLRGRLEQGVIDASGATPAIAACMRSAFAHFQLAVLQFDSYLGLYQRAVDAPPHGVDPVAYARLMLNDTTLLSDGRESFRACYNALEDVVGPAILAETKRVGE